MKAKAILAVLILAASAPAMAEKVVYACQYLASAGLRWEGGKWGLTSSNSPQPFFLVSENGELDQSSVARVFGLFVQNIGCHSPSLEVQTCSSRLGDVLIFSFQTLNGAYAETYGGSRPSSEKVKDSIVVSPFTCVKVK